MGCQGAGDGHTPHLFISPLLILPDPFNGDVGEHELAEKRHQILVDCAYVVLVGFTPDAALNLLLQCLATLTSNSIKASGLLRQALFFAESGAVIHLPCHSHCPVQSAMACAHTPPLAI